jgi:hypothetical protein
VPSGSRPIPGFLRVGTAALALTLAGGAARAQEANPEEANPLSSNHGDTSNTPNSNYVNDVFLLGVRVQR